jgi:Uma2 family endonuclease
MVLEVLSPKPRVGRIDRRIDWFARYGVEECWIYDQLAPRLEIVTFDRGAVAARVSFDESTPIRSAVFPAFDRTLGSIIAW